MNKKEFSQHEQQDFYNIFNNQVKKYTKDGSSLPQAISLVCKKFNLNPYKVIDTYYPEIKNKNKESYKDVKTEEGSFVTLNNDSSQNNYEVININNKDAIVLRNTNNNEEITASENEITPVIMENKMNKLNEAQYNISINGLETQDAATLSQMLSLADQAENVGGSMLAPEAMQNGMALNPMPMDMDSGLPMDMGSDTSMEEPVSDDIEFDEELPLDTDISTEEPSEIETDISIDEPMANSFSNEESLSNDLPIEMDMDTSIEEPMPEESISDMPMDDMMDSGMYDNNFMGENFDYDALIKEALEAVKLNEVEETIPANEFIDDNGQIEGEQEEYAEELSEANSEMEDEDDEELNQIYQNFMSCKFADDEIKSDLMHAGYASNEEEAQKYINKWSENDVIFDDSSDKSTDYDSEIAETLRLAGVQLNEKFLSDESEDKRYNEYQDDVALADGSYGFEHIKSDYLESRIDEEEAISELIKNNFSSNEEEAREEISKWDDELNGYNDELNGYNDESTDYDSEIAETLRLAGVQLNEEESNGPEFVDQKTLYINKDKEDEGQEPEYTEVDTTTFGKDASEGMKKSMTFEAAVNIKKIKSIYETAKSMYSKKDTSEWLSLDRRYVEKLIKEGVGYEKASKMLIDAKKGK